MPDVFDSDGNKLADIPLSDKQRTLLDAGQEVCVIYHTPQLMRSQLGDRNGSFLLSMNGDRLVTSTPEPFKQFAKLQAGIAAIKMQRAV